jgi:methionyl aminopeptidase
MIKLKTEADIEILRAGGRRLGAILASLSTKVAPGVTTADLDDYAQELIKKGGDTAAFLNYRPSGARLAYPAALCVSINDEIVHGIPSKRVIKDGDLVGLDLGLKHQGLITDAAITVPVGEISPEARRLMDGTKEALAVAIKVARVGKTVGDIGAAAEAVAKRYGLGVVRDLAGHGVGYHVHEDPSVPNFGRPGEGSELRPGLVIAIEPMFTLGQEETKLQSDGFTFVTKDGSLAAHFEHTIVVTKSGPEILTLAS